jgi:DNA sulfur modification protein DndB
MAIAEQRLERGDHNDLTGGEEFNGPMIWSHDSFNEAFLAASADAGVSQSIMSPALLYKQGDRHFILTTFSFQTLIRHVHDDAARKGEDPDSHINRPFMPPHSKEIANYLKRTRDYILPPLALNTQEPLTFYTIATASQVRMGFIVIPASLEFDVTDGQHRGNAVDDAIKERRDLGQDGIGVIISTEHDLEKIHQDFVDCARNKPILPAMLAAFDHANLVVRYVNETIKRVPFFEGRVDRSSVRLGKSTVKVFTLNQVQTALLEFLVGRVPAKDQIPKVGEDRLNNPDKMELHVSSAAKFLNDFTKANSQWRQFSGSVAGASGDDTYEMRQTQLHFNATGLVIIGKVGHAIFSKPELADRERLTKLLGEFDWSRGSSIWQGNVMSGYKITTSRDMFSKAAAILKQRLGLDLTDSEQRLLS